MHLTTFTDYGLRTLMYLQTNQEENHSVQDIAEHFDISRNHLVKVVHRLSQLGYIETSKGKGGGIRISNESAGLLLGDLIINLEPNMNMVECFDPVTNQCKLDGSCRLKHYLKAATASYINTMNQYSLADAVAKKG